MNCKIITPTKKGLYDFFLSLSNKTLYNFTPFGRVNEPSIARKTSEELTKKSLKEQKNFGIYINSKLIGFGFLKFFEKLQKKYTCSLGIVIGDGYQSKGYGAKLLQHMINWARNHRYKKIWLTVYSDNSQAMKLYKKFGFQIEGIFMYDEYFKKIPRHVVSMALIFDKNPIRLRKKIEEKITRI